MDGLKNIFIEKGQSLWPLQRILVASFVPYVASFSGLSFLTCPLVFSNLHFLVLYPSFFVGVCVANHFSFLCCGFCLVRRRSVSSAQYCVVPMSIDRSYVIASSVFSSVYFLLVGV